MKRIYKICVGKFRMFFNFCPECNSTAPQLDTCEVCQGELYPYIDGAGVVSVKMMKNIVWNNGTARIRHQCRKTTVLRYYRCLINTLPSSEG